MTIETKQKINCKECMGDRHNACLNPEICLCAEDNHGVKKASLKDGVKVDDKYGPPKQEPKEYEDSQKDAERLEELLENENGDNSELFTLYEITKLLILSRHMVSIIDLENKLESWCKRFKVDNSLADKIPSTVLWDVDIFTQVKQICFKLGEARKQIIFHKDQFMEISYWMMGRYHIKRIELTGDLLFFNDKYYEKNAEALIRRKARDCSLKSKNSDMNEIVKTIEDLCPLIIWKDVENSVHRKCLLNGIYDIERGIFSNKFDPSFIILNQIPHNYNEKVTFEEIEKIVKEIISDEEDRQSYYDSLSVSLHPYTGIDFQFGGVGRAGTGKSQICELAKLVLGKDNVSNAKIHLIATDQTTLKDIAYKMLNIDGEMSDDLIKHVDVLKKWITQDDFTARGIYEHSMTFKPMCRFFFMTNNLYDIPNSDDAEAIYERTHIININNKFRFSEKEKKNVIRKTATPLQLEGFITYLLKNANDIYKNQQIHYPMKYDVVEHTWNIHGNRIKEFVNKWIERGVSYRTETSAPYNKWLGYAIQKDFKPKTRKKFKEIFDELIGNVPTKTRIDGNECYAYTGFRIKTDEEITKEETTPLDVVKNEQALKALLFSSLEKVFKICNNNNNNNNNKMQKS